MLPARIAATRPEGDQGLRDWCASHCDITGITGVLLQAYHGRSQSCVLFLVLPLVVLLICAQDMLKSFAGSDVATQFHQAYYLQLLREVLAVMTDTFHTPGFKLHCRILLHLFGIVRNEAIIKAPLWDVTVSPL